MYVYIQDITSKYRADGYANPQSTSDLLVHESIAVHHLCRNRYCRNKSRSQLQLFSWRSRTLSSCPSICHSVCLCVCVSVCLCVCVSVCVSVCLCVCLSVCLSFIRLQRKINNTWQCMIGLIRQQIRQNGHWGHRLTTYVRSPSSIPVLPQAFYRSRSHK